MPLQVGFVVRLEGGRLTDDLADFLPDYKCACILIAASERVNDIA